MRQELFEIKKELFDVGKKGLDFASVGCGYCRTMISRIKFLMGKLYIVGGKRESI